MRTDRLLRNGLVAVFLCLGAMVHAQENRSHTPESYVAWIDSEWERITGLWQAGEDQAALDAALELNAAVDPHRDFLDGHEAYVWPDMLVVEFADKLGREDLILQYGPPAIVEMDTPTLRLSVARREILSYVTLTLYLQHRHLESEPFARTYLALTEEHAEPRLADKDIVIAFALAMSATRTKAPDAQDIRAETLSKLAALEGTERAQDGLYLQLQHIDLNERTLAGERSEELADLAQDFGVWLDATPERQQHLKYQDAKAQIARTLVVNDMVYEALPIMRAQLDHLSATAPLSLGRFWAWQNLVDTLGVTEAPEQAIEEGLRAIAAMDAAAPQMSEPLHGVRAKTLIPMANVARAMGQEAEEQRYLQEAYNGLRTFMSATDPDTSGLSARLKPEYLPEDFPYRAEVIGDTASVVPDADIDGATVLGMILDGRFREVDTSLYQMAAGGEVDAALVGLNWAYVFAFLGLTEDALSNVQFARDEAGGWFAKVAADSPFLDIAEALALVMSKNADAPTAEAMLVGVVDHEDLSPLHRHFVRAYLARALLRQDRLAEARDVAAQLAQDEAKAQDLSALGILATMNVAYVLQLTNRLEAAQQVRERQAQALAAADPARYRLARAMMEASAIVNAPDGIVNQQSFDRLAVLIDRLARMLPDWHPDLTSTRAAYADGLSYRGQHTDAATVLVRTIEAHRKMRGHDVNETSYLQLQLARAQVARGKIDLAHGLIEAAYTSLDRETAGAAYIAYAAQERAWSLTAQNRATEAIAVLDGLQTDADQMARLDPFRTSSLWSVRAEAEIARGDSDAGLLSYDKAVAALPSDAYLDGHPMAFTLFVRGMARRNLARYAGAYADLSRSNKLWFDFNAAAGPEAQRSRSQRDEAWSRVVWEASAGWYLAQEIRQKTQGETSPAD